LSILPTNKREIALRKVAVLEAGKAFDLSKGKLMRAKLIRLADDDHILVVATHHIVVDGWSLNLIVDEMAALYNSFCSNCPSELQEPAWQFGDFALWQQGRLSGKTLDSLLSYWKSYLQGMPQQIKLPFDRPRSIRSKFRGGKHFFTVEASVSKSLMDLCASDGATPFMVLLSAFSALLARYSGQSDMVIGSPFANRGVSGSEKVVGYFNNTLILRIKHPDLVSFRQLISLVRSDVLAAFEHQELPFEQLVRAMQPVRDVTRTALFQVNFRVQNEHTIDSSLSGLKANYVDIDNGTSKFDLACSMTTTAEGLKGYIEYNSELFEQTTAHRIAHQFQEFLARLLASPDMLLKDLPKLQ